MSKFTEDDLGLEFEDRVSQLEADGQASADTLRRLERSFVASEQDRRAPERISVAGRQFSAQTAKVLGLMYIALVQRAYGREGRAIDELERSGVAVKDLTEGTDSAGGFLVPVEHRNELVRLVELFGAFRRNVRAVPMAGDRQEFPRRTGGFTVYFPGEGGSITASDMTFDAVGLTARKMAALTAISSELFEDAAVEIGGLVAEEMAHAIAEKEDQMGFNGDGTSTYGGVVGVIPKLTGLDATVANVAGLVQASTNSKTAWTNVSAGDLNKMLGRLPDFADNDNARIFCHRRFWSEVLVGVSASAGGVSRAEIEARPVKSFHGYPVEFVNVMPRVTAASSVVCLFGDLGQAAKLGERRRLTVDTDRSVHFTSDRIAIRAIQRIAITVHDVGNADATEANRTAGPIVGLITDA
jgi:HK97 family phage major capsid protein